MSILYITTPLSAILIIVLTIGLGFFIAKRLGQPWTLFGIGAVTFIASQVVHIPLNSGLTALFQANILPSPPIAWKLPFNALVLGFTAGLCEEVARYLVYRFWIKSARSWGAGLMFGAGHGGIEAMITAGIIIISLVQLSALRTVDVTTLPYPPEQQAAIAKQVSDFWGSVWYMPFIGMFERVFAVCLHLSLSVMVLQAFRRRNLAWLLAAIGWHWLVDSVAVFAAGTWGIYWTEAIIAVTAIISVGIIFILKTDEAPPAPTATPVPDVAPASSVVAAPPPPAPESPLDESRYTG